jgi:hypothetical protein
MYASVHQLLFAGQALIKSHLADQLASRVTSNSAGEMMFDGLPIQLLRD